MNELLLSITEKYTAIAKIWDNLGTVTWKYPEEKELEDLSDRFTDWFVPKFRIWGREFYDQVQSSGKDWGSVLFEFVSSFRDMNLDHLYRARFMLILITEVAVPENLPTIGLVLYRKLIDSYHAIAEWKDEIMQYIAQLADTLYGFRTLPSEYLDLVRKVFLLSEEDPNRAVGGPYQDHILKSIGLFDMIDATSLEKIKIFAENVDHPYPDVRKICVRALSKAK